MTWTELAAIATAFGLGAVIRSITTAIIKALTGKHAKEQTAWTRADRESRRADREAKARRKLEETLQQTRHMLHRRGVPYEEMPLWPPYVLTDEE